MMDAKCPRCGEELEAEDSLAEKEVNCPTCSHEFTLPSAAQVGAVFGRLKNFRVEKKMRSYLYTALDKNGREHTGSLIAETPSDAISQIELKGFFPTRVALSGSDMPPTFCGEQSQRNASRLFPNITMKSPIVLASLIAGIVIMIIIILVTTSVNAPRAERHMEEERCHTSEADRRSQVVSHSRPAASQSTGSYAQSDRESFYNPDRNPPYLANLNSAHTTRSAAITALASQFEQSSIWVERNMGSDNSLTSIHNNLVRAKYRDSQTASHSRSVAPQRSNTSNQRDRTPSRTVDKRRILAKYHGRGEFLGYNCPDQLGRDMRALANRGSRGADAVARELGY